MTRFFNPLVFAIVAVALISYNPHLDGIVSAKLNSEPLELLRITPDGQDVPLGRQIVFQFSRPVVPVGRMQRDASEIPVTITPELDCQWRWLNTSALACQLGEKSALKPATQYNIVMDPGIAAEDGATLSETIKHRFVTERPKLRHAWFKTWKSPGTPVIRMTFNQPVSQLSVELHVYMFVYEKQTVRVALNVEPDRQDKQTPFILPMPGEKRFLITNSSERSEKAAEKAGQKEKGIEARRVWQVSPRAELPLDTRVELKVEPGLVSYLGPQKGVEDRLAVEFYTFPEFAFEGVECTDINDQKIIVEADTAPSTHFRCDPLSGAALVFSAPVIEEEVKDHVRFTPDLAGGRADYDPWANRRGYSRLRSPHRQGRKYRVWLPEVLKAFAAYHIRSDPQQFQDEFGRTLVTPIDMQFATDHRKSDFTLTHPRAVLEKDVDTDVPLVVTNLDEVSVTYDRLTAESRVAGQKQQIPVPEAEDVAFRIPLQVRDMLGHQSGIVQGTVSSRPHVSKHHWERWFFAQVTPFQVHVKVGHFNTLVWVTDFHSGEPVRDAEVKIFKDTYAALSDQPRILTRAITNNDGVALLEGTEIIDPELKIVRADRMQDPRLFVRIEKDGDLALVPLDYQFRIDTYRASRYTVSSSMRPRFGHIHTWGTTAQGVYRAGDVIQYKLYVRNQSNQTLVPATREGYRLQVTDPMGKTVYEVKDVVLSEFGAHHGEFTVPKTGAVGWYRFQLSAAFSKYHWQPMRVLVSDFTPAAFRVSTELNRRHYQPGDEIQIATRARLHAGGPYADAFARVAVTLEKKRFQSEAPVARGFRFDTHAPKSRPKQTIHQTESAVDSSGNMLSRFTISENPIIYGNLVVESAVRDDRGKYIAGREIAEYAARDRLVGLRSSAWILHEDRPAAVELLVVDQLGEPVSGISINVKVERKETKAARVKGAGNAYLTQYTHQWVPVSACELSSTLEPVSCQFTPQNPGSHRISAEIRDSRGRRHSSRLYRWVVGKGRVIWQQEPNNSLEIIAEKPTCRVGDKARYLVKNPFPGAQALVTIERYGVLKSWLQRLDTTTTERKYPGI